MGRHRRTRQTHNIKKDNDTEEWIVFKRYEQLKEPVIYNRFKRFADAKKYRDYLDEHDLWLKETPRNIRLKLLNPGKNYYQEGKSYRIYKTVKGITADYGRYSTGEEAKKVVNALIENDWDYNKLPDELKELQLPIPSNKHRYYTDKPVKYYLRKYLNGHSTLIGVYESYNDAVRVREYLEKHEWDITLLPDELVDLSLKKKEPKYYCYNPRNDNYVVNKYINNNYVYFGAVDTKAKAEEAVEYLKSINWDKKLFRKNYKELNV